MIELSAGEAVAAMTAGEITAEAYADALLARCAAASHLNAFITLEPEQVRESARAADARRAAGEALGPLHGLPIPVKDSVNTRDLPTTAGTAALRAFRPARDATAVARLRAAGASVLGKTNLHELSFGWTSNNLAFGPVRNPYDPSRIRAGAAAARRSRWPPAWRPERGGGHAGLDPGAGGVVRESAGSGQRPGAIRTTGTAPITPLFDQIGPHARVVADLALFDAVMTGDARPITPAPLKGLRLGLIRGYYFEGLDPEVERVTDDALEQLRAAGVVLVEAEAPRLAELVGLVTAQSSCTTRRAR
jgi:mandelamide amidase